MKTILTHTGKIYVDTEHKLEFLTVGDYGKENNIKANFLGLTKEINGVANTEVDLSKKNDFYGGEAGLQFSINSTDDKRAI